MKNIFNNVPADDYTVILLEFENILDDYQILYQKWCWDNITAESIIFANTDVAELSDNEIEEMVIKSPLFNQGSKLTLSRSDSGFTFVNFNFVTE